VYSFGIILWELYYRKVPFSDMSTFEIPLHVIEGKRPPLTKELPRSYCKLMKACWFGKSSKRPSFTQIIKVLTKMQPSPDNTPLPPRKISPLPRANSRDRSYSMGSVGPVPEKILSSESAPGGGSPGKTPAKLSMRMGLISKSSKRRARENGHHNGSASDDGKSG